MMFPTLILVSVAPASYFFYESAPLLVAASTAMAAEKAANRNWITGMWVSLRSDEDVMFFDWRRFSAPLPHSIPSPGAQQEKAPCDEVAGGPLIRRRVRGIRFGRGLAANLTADDRSEQVPLLALETHHLKLFDRIEVGRAGVDLHARQQGVEVEVLEARGLFHDVVAGQVVACLLQHLYHGLGLTVAKYDRTGILVGFRRVFGEEGVELLHPLGIVPLRVGSVLGVSRGEYALGVFETCGLQHRADGSADVALEVHRLPAEFGDPLDALGGELRRGHAEVDVGAGRFQLDDVRVNGRLGNFVAFLGHDHRRRLVAKTVFQAFQQVLTEIVVLIHDRDLGARLLLQQVLRVDLAFALVGRLPAHGPGKVLVLTKLGGAGRDEKLRDLLGVQIFLNGRVRRRSKGTEHEQNLVAFDQLARLLNGLRRAVAVVIADKVDLAAVHAALFVDHLEVGFFDLADHAVGGSRTAIGHDIAELDLGIGRAGVVLLLGEGTAAHGSESDDRRRERGDS